MFYSQIILAKKGPLGKVWMAAHWGDKKLGRPQIFSTNIADSVNHIMHPSVPLALRVSGHLLLGVVRIYSRQVHYVLQDCHEAMIKIKLAFHPTTATATRGDQYGHGGDQEVYSAANVDMATTTTTGRRSLHSDANLHVANFGEYTMEGGVLGAIGAEGAFALELPLIGPDGTTLAGAGTNEWVLAEDFAEPSQQKTTQDEVLDTTLDSRRRYDQEEEPMLPFDPDEEDVDDRHVFDDTLNTTKDASDVEMVRAADRSKDSSGVFGDSVAGRANSSLLGAAKKDGEYMSDDDLQPMMDDEEDDLHRAGRDSSLALDSTVGGGRRLDSSSIGGLEDDSHAAAAAEQSKPKAKRKKSAAGPKRMRKRRKVVVDNGETQLTSAHIKEMLKDTSDIVLPHVPFASDWIPGQAGSSKRKTDLGKTLPPDELWTRPSIADDGMLAPELLQIFQHNMATLAGKPFPFRMRGKAGELQRQERAQQAMQSAAQAEDAEQGRSAGVQDDEDDFMPPPIDDEDDLQPPPQDDELEDDAPLFDDDEEEPFADAKGREDDFASDMAAMTAEDDLTLEEQTALVGAVDNLADESGAPASTGWHKHTIKVLAMLKRNIKSPGAPLDEDEPKPATLSYGVLSEGCCRRTAAAVFFELLQLKTWDYIELDQDESYGDITITAGNLFNEGPATN